ncbi:MAG TPA: hypothetical protein DEO59_10255 [Balneola sp.]|jgi:hypothetical protein|nr:hypothetical protein [Balneola sp.]|tara:strand:- start:3591 stop:3782 length:192 start_codon:yes stop_codon:yes gene_type:complete
MGAMKWFLMGVEELIDPDKTLEENVTTNINNKVEVRGEKFGITKDDIEYAYGRVMQEGEQDGY